MNRFNIAILILLLLGRCGLALGAESLSAELKQADQQFQQVLTNVRQTGDLDRARTALEPIRINLESLHAQFLALKNESEASFAILRAADCLRIVNRWSDALPKYQQAVNESQQAKRLEVQAKAWLGIERVQRMGLRDYGAADEAIHHANLLLSNQPDLWTIQADVWAEQSELELVRGETQSALLTLGKAIALCMERKDDDGLWRNLFGRAGIYFDMADADRKRFVDLPIDSKLAWKANEELALKIRREYQESINDTETGLEVAKRANASGLAQLFASEPEQRRQIAQQVEQIFRTKRMAWELVEKRGESNAAPREPLMVKPNGELIEADLVRPALSAGDNEQTKQVAALLKELNDEKRPQSNTWRRLFVEGEIKESQGQLEEALQVYREAAKIIRKERHTLNDERLRATFITEKMGLYERLILNLLQLRRYDEAFAWMEESRSKAMLDAMTTLQAHFPKTAERQLYGELVAAQSRVGSAASSEERTAAERQEDAVLERIRQKAPKLLELVESQPVELSLLKTKLTETPCDLVYYILHAGRIVLWHIGPTRIDVRAYYASASQLQSLVRDVVESVARPGDFDTQSASELYTYLAKPALEKMETKHLVIVAAPELAGLPFQALFDKDKQQYFGEQIALSYGPSASTVAKLAPARKLGSAHILIAVGPGLSTNGGEANKIAAQYQNHEILTGSAATSLRVAKEVRGVNVVHIAAHGEYKDEDPMASAIELSDGAGGVSHLSAAQMLSWPLAGVTAVTLGSCSTGKAKVLVNGESYGFLRSLLYAGAQSVVLPLWKIPDEGAAFWFESFYKNAQTQDLAEAARLAIVAARQHAIFGAHPRYWAGYQMFGR